MKALGLLALVISSPAFTQVEFELAGTRVAQGEMRSFHAKAADVEVPITIVNGARPGPVLTLTAGVHGDEFAPILALQRLRASIDPQQLSGTLVIVHLANLAGFHGRRIALSPLDEKNLNRVFPGREDGTPTEQLAHFLTTEVVARTDYLIDVHSGSSNQALWPHVYSPVVGDAELDARTLAFAKSTGLRHIVLYGERPRDPARSISYPNTAQTRGKPGLTVEVGQLGGRDAEWVEQILTACRNAMRHLGLLREPEVQNTGFTLYDRLHEVESPVTGVFHPRAALGELVDTGALLGTVTNYFGEPLAELYAPTRGIVLMINHTPPVRAGETPVTIAQWQ